jgi:D-xylose 1-dehydrogenase (NADP+, D-xylono-1,5-lactone-forming)
MTAREPLRIGILGAARIARQFCAAVAGSKHVTITAVAARDGARAEVFAKETGVPRVHASYEALLADPAIEAVYVPLPNGLHAEWAIKAAKAGKHVLCEKPLAVDEAEARAMFAAARDHKVHLVEGYPYLAQPQTLKARELVRTGAVGRLQLIRTSFGVPFSDAADIRFDPKLAGGALMDAGSYAFSMVRAIAGERPSRVHAVAQWAATGVDRAIVATIEFRSGLLAQISGSFTTAYHRHAHIAGDAGIIETTFLNHPPLGGPPTVTIRRGPTAVAEIETMTLAGGNGFLLEAEQFAGLVRGDAAQWTGATEQESIDIAATLDAVLRSARGGTPVLVAE